MTQRARVLGILKADSVNPDLQLAHGDYTDMFQAIFRAAEARIRVVAAIFRVAAAVPAGWSELYPNGWL